MGTHDMETYNYFRKTNVMCALCPREMDKSELSDYFQNEFATGAYTHHQVGNLNESGESSGW